MFDLDLQISSKSTNELPNAEQIKTWLEAAILKQDMPITLTVRIVDSAESHQLNLDYRKKDRPTNVLSFPFEMPPEVKLPQIILGDLVICTQVVTKEALEQNKPLMAHWAHMLVHGCLHLQGFDHIDSLDAQIMEAKEIEIMAHLGFNNPYQDDEY